MSSKLRLALMVSGGGTTMREILRACTSGRLSGIEPVCVIASKPGIGAIDKALAEGMAPERILVRHKAKMDIDAFGEQLLLDCRVHGVDIIGQYGWMPKTPGMLIDCFPQRMINQHPGALDPGYPDFGGQGMYGRRVHAASVMFAHAVKRRFTTEATAQFVDKEFDRGVVIQSFPVAILEEDDPITLQERVLPVEHEVQIRALEQFAAGIFTSETRNVRLIEPTAHEEALLASAKTAAALMFPKG